MFNVSVDRLELIEILQTNKANHRATFLKAQEKYREAMIAAFEQRLQKARDNEEIDTYFNFPVPVDHTEDYERAIKMLNMHQKNEVELDEDTYESYCEDTWHWSRQWITTNASYGLK